MATNLFRLVQTCYAARKYYTNYTNSNQKGIQYDNKILKKKIKKYTLPSKSIVHFRKPKICNFSLIIKKHQNGYKLYALFFIIINGYLE
jgi:hypothetical protein